MKPRFLWSVRPLLIGLALSGCGKAPSAPNVAPGPRLPGANVERWREEGGPTFHFVTRKGDPEAALTQVWALGSPEDAWLARAALEDLARDASSIEVGASFVAVTWLDADPGALEGRVRRLWDALATRTTADARWLPRALALLAEAGRHRGTLEEVCLGAPTVHSGAAKFSDLERVYSSLRNPADWLIGGVGPRNLREGFERRPLPRGVPSSRERFDLRSPKLGPRASTEPVLLGAVQTSSTEEAFWIEDSLGAHDSALRTRLSALNPTFETRLVGASRPGGRCVLFEARLPSAAGTPEVTLAWARRTFESELARARERVLEAPTAARLLLTQTTAAQAAREAALTAFEEAEDGPPVVRWEVSGPARLTLDAVESAGRKLAVAPLETRVLDEEGQAEFRLLLASPCGTRGERDADSGLRALLVTALARSADSPEIRVAPWISAEGIGLLATGPLRPGESDAAQASRVARALAALLVRPKIEGSVLAAARENLLAEVTEDPAYALGLRLLAPEHPALLAPKGLGATLAKLGTVEVQRAQSEWLNEPLRLVVARSGDALQGPVASQDLAEILAPHRHDVVHCAAPKVDVPRPGVFTVLSVDEAVRPSRSILIPLDVRREVGHALAEWVTLRGGALDRGVRESGLVTDLAASFLGGGAEDRGAPGGLWVKFGAEAANLERAEHQVRAALDALRSRTPSDEEVRELDARRVAWLRGVRRHPEARLIEAFLGRPSTPVSSAEVASALAGLRAEAHLVVRVDRRK